MRCRLRPASPAVEDASMGVTLSRWTMAYFAAALLCLILGESLMTAGYGFPSAPIPAPQTLVVVHLITIGWLSLLLCGALFQFVPVLVARPLHSNSLPLPTLALLLAGLGALLTGFLQLSGTIEFGLWSFPLAAGLLATGFALVLYNLGCTLWRARPLPLPARFVAAALVWLAATITFGAIFSLAFAGSLHFQMLSKIAAGGLPLHVVAGLGGWLTFAAMGVGYRLLSMFMLAPEMEGARPRAVFWLGTAALVATVLGGVAQLLRDASILPALSGGIILGLAALALYGADILYLYRTRKRRILELNSEMAALSLISLAATIAMIIVLSAMHRLSEQIGAVVFLAALGWLTGLGLAKVYKIVAFLTWLECYGPVLGKMPTPRVQDLVIENRARPWFVLYFVSVWSAAVAILAAQPVSFRIAAGVMTVSTIVITAQLVRTRLLSDIAARLPDGVRHPHLLVSIPTPDR